MDQTDDHIQDQTGPEGKDYTLAVNDEFRERLINELRHFPNIFVIAGNADGATHTMRGDNEQMARAIIHIFRQNPNLTTWFKQILADV